MNNTKLKLIFNSFLLYFLGKIINRYKGKINVFSKELPLYDKRLADISNIYQNLTAKWIKIEKKVLLLRVLVLYQGHLNL